MALYDVLNLFLRDGQDLQRGGCLRDFRNRPNPIRLKIRYYENVLTVSFKGSFSCHCNCYFIFFTINLYSGCDVASLTALEYVMVWFNTQNKFKIYVPLTCFDHIVPWSGTEKNHKVKSCSGFLLQCNAPYHSHPTNFHIWQLCVNMSTQQPMQWCSTLTVRTLQGGVTVHQIHTPFLADNL